MTRGPGPVGLDFDNTIICYDQVFAEAGIAMDLLEPGFSGGKTAVRAAVRALPDGEALWQRLQAAVYGREIGRAVPFDGVREFLARCRHADLPVVVVSHKTRFAAADPGGADLRAASLAWLESMGFFDPAVSPLSPGCIHFADSRAEKAATIRRLGCRLFVDDLEEVFLDPAYPREVPGLLFSGEAIRQAGPWRVVTHWREVSDGVFPPA